MLILNSLEASLLRMLFLPLSQRYLPSILSTMRGAIERELEEGSHIYFDITGGESLILVAAGMLKKFL